MTTETELVATRLSLQAVAEHVLCAARHRATGRIGLRAAPGGFATPPFPGGHGLQTLAVDGTDLVRSDDRGSERTPLTTVADAARLAEIDAGAPAEVFTPTTPLDPSARLAIDPAAAAHLARWWGLVDDALAAFRAEHAADEPTETQLWPEHFDIAATVREVNYGGSPGDAAHPLPYLYIGPWSPPAPDGRFWNAPFGALVPAHEVPTVEAALALFEQGRALLT